MIAFLEILAAELRMQAERLRRRRRQRSRWTADGYLLPPAGPDRIRLDPDEPR